MDERQLIVRCDHWQRCSQQRCPHGEAHTQPDCVGRLNLTFGNLRGHYTEECPFWQVQACEAVEGMQSDPCEKGGQR